MTDEEVLYLRERYINPALALASNLAEEHWSRVEQGELRVTLRIPVQPGPIHVAVWNTGRES